MRIFWLVVVFCLMASSAWAEEAMVFKLAPVQEWVELKKTGEKPPIVQSATEYSGVTDSVQIWVGGGGVETRLVRYLYEDIGIIEVFRPMGRVPVVLVDDPELSGVRLVIEKAGKGYRGRLEVSRFQPQVTVLAVPDHTRVYTPGTWDLPVAAVRLAVAEMLGECDLIFDRNLAGISRSNGVGLVAFPKGVQPKGVVKADRESPATHWNGWAAEAIQAGKAPAAPETPIQIDGNNVYWVMASGEAYAFTSPAWVKWGKQTEVLVEDGEIILVLGPDGAVPLFVHPFSFPNEKRGAIARLRFALTKEAAIETIEWPHYITITPSP